jgi:hypothetical protein
LNSALVGVVSVTTFPFYPGKRIPGTPWIGSWVGLREGLDDMEKLKFLTLPGPELRSLGRPARSSCCTDYATAAHVRGGRGGGHKTELKWFMVSGPEAGSSMCDEHRDLSFSQKTRSIQFFHVLCDFVSAPSHTGAGIAQSTRETTVEWGTQIPRGGKSIFFLSTGSSTDMSPP